jgi:hypothetical protein
MRTVNSWSLEWNGNGTGMRHRVSSLSKRPKPSDKDSSVGEIKGSPVCSRAAQCLCKYATARQGQMVAAARWGLMDKARESATPESACAPRRAQSGKRWMFAGRGSEVAAEAEAENALLYISGIWCRLSAVYHDMAAWPVWRPESRRRYQLLAATATATDGQGQVGPPCKPRPGYQARPRTCQTPQNQPNAGLAAPASGALVNFNATSCITPARAAHPLPPACI